MNFICDFRKWLVYKREWYELQQVHYRIFRSLWKLSQILNLILVLHLWNLSNRTNSAFSQRETQHLLRKHITTKKYSTKYLFHSFPFFSILCKFLRDICSIGIFQNLGPSLEAVAQTCSMKKLLFKIPRNSLENTCDKVLLLVNLQTSAGKCLFLRFQ